LVLALVAVVGIAVFASSYFGFFVEGRGYSDRVGVRSRADAVESQALHPGALTTFASPYLHILRFYNPNLWEYTDISMSSVYLGGVCTIFAFLGIVGRPRSRWRWWLLTTALFFIACALGRALPLRGWLYDWLPPMRYFRNPALFRAYAMFSLALLALLATKDLQKAIDNGSREIWRRLAILSPVIALGAIVSYIFVMRSVEQHGIHFREATVHLLSVWCGITAISYLALAKSKWRKLVPLLLIVVALSDATLSYRLASGTIFDRGTEREAWKRVDAGHDKTLDLSRSGLKRESRPPDWIGPQLNDMNIPLGIPTFENYATLINRFQIDFLWRRSLLETMSTGEQRTWFSKNIVMTAPTDAAYDAFLKRSQDLGAPVFLVHSREEMSQVFQASATVTHEGTGFQAISTLSPAKLVSTKVSRYWPNELILDVSCPSEGWILVTDRWSPGWQLLLNKKPAELFGGNFIFRAVRVPSGDNELRFSYHPRGWPGLLILSWGTLAFVALDAVFHRAH